jgi:hypothetical protein
MKFKHIFFLLIAGPVCISQTREIPAEIIKVNGDTIKSNIRVEVNIFNKNLLNEQSITKAVKIVDVSGNKTKISAKDIKKLTFTDFNDSERIFVSDGKSMREMIYENILKCYIYYTANPYDRSKVAQMEFYDEDGIRVKSPPFTTSTRTLKKAVKEKPELVEIIEKAPVVNNEIIRLVLKKYEDDYLMSKKTN